MQTPLPIPNAKSSAKPIASSEAYRQAGVDLDSAKAVVEVAKKAAKRTLRPDLKFGGLGGFSGAFQLPPGYKQPVLLVGCDGVGTKLELAQQLNQHTTIGQDLVAMCVNDILAQGGEPLVFLDYMATGKLSLEALAEVLEGIAIGCELAGCVLAGGETAEMPGFYPVGQYDLAGFTVGVAEASNPYPKLENLQAGDVLIGLASSGLHSNGYSLVRHLLSQHPNLDLQQAASPGANSLANWLLEPTRIYVKPVLQLLKTLPTAVKAMVHVTGGGFIDNLPRALPHCLDAHLNTASWDWPPVYSWLAELGALNKATLLHTFNCGIGYVLMVEKEQADAVLAYFNESAPEATHEIERPKAYVIGNLQPASHVEQEEAQVLWSE